MIKNFLNRFTEDTADHGFNDLREYTRIPEEFASIIINGSEYTIEDWSKGGAYIKGIAHNLHIDDHVNFTLKFTLPHEDVMITHSGFIVRKGPSGFALNFDLHTEQSKKNFARVMDGVLSRGFADSSLATYE